MTPPTDLVCAHCGVVLSQHHCVSKGAPELRPGDLMLCGQCGQINTVNPDMKLQPIQDAEIKNLHPVEARDLKLAMMAVIARAKKHNRKHIIVPPWLR